MPDETIGVTPAPSSPAPSPAPSASAPAAAAPGAEPSTGGSVSPTPTPAPPKTMKEGFEQAFAKADATNPPTPDATSPGSDAPSEDAPPLVEAKPGEAKPKPKWIPYERHEAIITNARAKEREAVIAEVGKRLGWAVNYQPEQVSYAMEIARRLEQDPVQFVQGLVREIAKDPVLKQRLQQSRAAQSGPPPPDMETNDGKHRFYSAEGLAKRDAWLAQRLSARFEERLAPFEQNLQEQRATQHETRVRETARQHLAEMETRPLFAEHAHEIIAAMEADGRVTVQSAYDRIVLPKLAALDKEREAKIRREEREAAIAELRQKAGAGSLNPGAASAPPVGRPSREPTAAGFAAEFARVSATR